MNRRQMLVATAAIAATPLLSSPAFAGKPPIFTTLFSNAAVGGYDPVSYFTDGMPMEGKSEFTYEYMGADWYFVSMENLDKFIADPAKYAPQFGGYCAYGVSQGATVKGDPKLWKIVDGKLYFNINKQVVKIWTKDIPGYINQANNKWPNVLN